MTELVKPILLTLMSEKCFDNYFVAFDFFDGECFKAVLSKCLGIGIIAGSLLVKVPQIAKILSNKSAEGINLFSVCLDLFAITFHISYSYVKGFPFSAWGDGTFLCIQTAMIAALVLYFGGDKGKAMIFLVSYSLILYSLMGGLTPIEILWILQGFNVPIIFIGKMSQGYTNYKNSSTGQLSAATCFMLFFGSLARIFTSIQETGDSMMVLLYCVSTFANGIIVAQLIYYWNKTPKQKKPVHEKKKPKPKSKKAD